MAVVFIELPLQLVHPAGIQIGIMADGERVDDAIIRSWLFIRRQALPDYKHLLGEVLDIVAVFHHRDPSLPR
jgi:hypothetical protein